MFIYTCPLKQACIIAVALVKASLQYHCKPVKNGVEFEVNCTEDEFRDAIGVVLEWYDMFKKQS